jgi:hypothetical protein
MRSSSAGSEVWGSAQTTFMDLLIYEHTFICQDTKQHVKPLQNQRPLLNAKAFETTINR